MKTIKLTQGKVALVDDADYSWLNQHKWYAAKYTNGKFYYAVRKSPRLGSKQRTICMHRLILNAPNGVEVDHINGNGLDNRRVNLRRCTCSENSMNQRLSCGNTIRFKGVSLMRRNLGKPYRATITVNSKGFYLGNHRTAEDAARAYDVAALRHFKEFALTNEMLGLL